MKISEIRGKKTQSPPRIARIDTKEKGELVQIRVIRGKEKEDQ
ncbi:hypothetical protein [Candidatus Amarolinea dominans]